MVVTLLSIRKTSFRTSKSDRMFAAVRAFGCLRFQRGTTCDVPCLFLERTKKGRVGYWRTACILGKLSVLYFHLLFFTVVMVVSRWHRRDWCALPVFTWPWMWCVWTCESGVPDSLPDSECGVSEQVSLVYRIVYLTVNVVCLNRWAWCPG